jgi:hypothetical protein
MSRTLQQVKRFGIHGKSQFFGYVDEDACRDREAFDDFVSLLEEAIHVDPFFEHFRARSADCQRRAERPQPVFRRCIAPRSGGVAIHLVLVEIPVPERTSSSFPLIHERELFGDGPGRCITGPDAGNSFVSSVPDILPQVRAIAW